MTNKETISENYDKILELKAKEMSIRKIADELGINRGSVEYVINKAKTVIQPVIKSVIKSESVIESVIEDYDKNYDKIYDAAKEGAEKVVPEIRHEADEKSEAAGADSGITKEERKAGWFPFERAKNPNLCEHYGDLILGGGTASISHCVKAHHSLDGKFSDCRGDVDSCPFSYKF